MKRNIIMMLTMCLLLSLLPWKSSRLKLHGAKLHHEEKNGAPQRRDGADQTLAAGQNSTVTPLAYLTNYNEK